MVNITLLGEQSVVDPVTERTLTLSARSLALLGLLISHTGSPQSRSAIAGAFWPDSTERQALTNLRRELHDLRHLIDDDSLEVTPTQLCWHDRDRHRVDLGTFLREHAAAKAAGDDESAIRHGTAALEQYAGELMPGLDGDWLDDARTRLRESCVELCDLVSAAAERAGRLDVAADAMRKRISLDAYDERPYRRLMELQAADGDRAGAVRTYDRLSGLLEADLGLAPDPVTTRTLAGITGHDANVSGPAPTVLIGRARGLDHRRTRLGALVTTMALVAALAGGSAILGRDSPASAAVPPNTVSELDGSGAVLGTVPVGTNPVALAAAGDAIWVVNAGDDNVWKVNPSTHAVQQVLYVGHDPRALAVTGDDLWVTNFADGTLSRINVLGTGKVVDTIPVGSDPDAIAAGPAGLWVADSGDNTIQRIDTTSGTPGKRIDVGDGPDGLAVDDTSVWVANGRAGSVMRIDARTGEQMNAPIRVGSGPRGIVRLGEDVWVADELSQSVTRITVATGHTRTIDAGDGPTALAVLDGSVWVAEKYSGDLLRIDPGTEKPDRIDVHAPVQGVATAGDRIWVAAGAFVSTNRRGGTLRMAATALAPHFRDFDPARAYDPLSAQLVRAVYDGLLAYHYAGADPQVLVPDLATSVPEPTDGGKTYTFSLRPGIRYATGAEVKASDLVRGVHRALLASFGGRPDFYAGILGGQACIIDRASCDLSRGVVADDAAGRVTFHLVAPDLQFLYKLTVLVVPTPPGTPLGRITSPLPGTGPYRIAAYTRGKRFTFARNTFFHQWSAAAQPAGFARRIAWVKVADAHKAADAVRQGRADLAELITGGKEGPASVGRLIHGLRVTMPSRVHSSIVQYTTYALLNSSKPPFDHLLARQAFSYAVDRRKAVKLLGGPSVAIPTCQLIPPSMPSYRPYCPYTTGPSDGGYHGPDLPRARDLVRASGTRGMKVEVTDLVDNPLGPLDGYFAHVLRTLGYRATHRRLQVTPRNEGFFWHPRSGTQVEPGGWVADFPLPSNFYELVACGAPADTPFEYCNRDLDHSAAAATVMMQTDPGAALRTWTDIDRKVTDQAPLVPVANGVDTWLTSERVGNYQSGAVGIGPLLSQLWVR